MISLTSYPPCRQVASRSTCASNYTELSSSSCFFTNTILRMSSISLDNSTMVGSYWPAISYISSVWKYQYHWNHMYLIFLMTFYITYYIGLKQILIANCEYSIVLMVFVKKLWYQIATRYRK